MALINCPECGGQVSDKAAFCPKCGFPIKSNEPDAAVCPQCGNTMQPNSMFCGRCGHPVSIEHGGAIIKPPAASEEQKSEKDKDINSLLSSSMAPRAAQTARPPVNPIPAVQTNAARCPKCGSTSLSAGAKGFGVGKAAVGAVLLGPVGLLAGGIGMNKTVVTCLSCGHKFEFKQ